MMILVVSISKELQRNGSVLTFVMYYFLNITPKKCVCGSSKKSIMCVDAK
uniref:Uncharacterized protein n=1 Tax=Medicago truncatula TaxID=3880 RepID=A2Q5V0_MEDTR|nr:hypothetical protein MtrDRAFT_AC169177g8v1 [Medicago truncatula]